MRFTASAFRHGITQRQIESALEVPMRRRLLEDDLLLVIAATDAGNLLEIVVADSDSDDERVIHAMPLRSKFYHYL